MRARPLHVLQVTGPMNRAGAEVMLMHMYRNMSPRVRFDFLVHGKRDNPRPRGDFDEEIVRLGGGLYYIGTPYEMGIFAYIRRFRNVVREIGTPDAAHIHLNAKCGMIALAARLSGIRKIIAHSHAVLRFQGPLRSTLPKIVELRLQKPLIAMFATDIWACSEEAIASLASRWAIRRVKTAVINNAIDVEAFCRISEQNRTRTRASYGTSDGTFVLGNVGRVVRHKKVDFVLDVLQCLGRGGADYALVFAGRADDGRYMEEIRTKIRTRQLEAKVVYLGDRDDIPAVMSTFDVFVGPAVREGFGVVAVEAQAAGVPCVLSTGFPRTVDMGLGLVTFIHDYDPARWADAIVKAIRTRCSDRALIREKFRERGFDAAENARHVERLFRS